MSNETLTRPTDVTAPDRRSPLLWILGLIVALTVGVVAGWLVFGGNGAESTVDAAIEQEITTLIDDWLTARNNADGELAQSLFTADGKYVSRNPGLDGWSGADLKAGIERFGAGGIAAEMVARPQIIEREDSYHAAVKIRPFSFGKEYFLLFNISDESGTLRIRYTNDWMALGWFRLADDLPYQPINVVD
jgi:hypothetical protein